jgi:hypothetical protein
MTPESRVKFKTVAYAQSVTLCRAKLERSAQAVSLRGLAARITHRNRLSRFFATECPEIRLHRFAAVTSAALDSKVETSAE